MKRSRWKRFKAVSTAARSEMLTSSFTLCQPACLPSVFSEVHWKITIIMYVFIIDPCCINRCAVQVCSHKAIFFRRSVSWETQRASEICPVHLSCPWHPHNFSCAPSAASCVYIQTWFLGPVCILSKESGFFLGFLCYCTAVSSFFLITLSVVCVIEHFVSSVCC